MAYLGLPSLQRIAYILPVLQEILTSLFFGLLYLPSSLIQILHLKLFPYTSTVFDSPAQYKSISQHRTDVKFLASRLSHAYSHGLKVCISRKPSRSGTSARSSIYKNALPVQLDFSHMNGVLDFNVENKTVTCESGVSLSQLCAETLEKGLLPAVVPELRGITVGGAVQGLGVESSSIWAGTFDCGILDAEFLVPDANANGKEKGKASGDGLAGIIKKSHDSELWKTTVGSVGSVSLITQATLRLHPATKWCKLRYVEYPDHKGFVKEVLRKRAAQPQDSDVNTQTWIQPDACADAIAFRTFTIGMFGGCVSDAEAAEWRRQGGDVYQQHAASPAFFQHVLSVASKRSSDEAVDSAASMQQEQFGILIHTELIPMHVYLFRYDLGGFWAGHVLAGIMPGLHTVLHNSILRFVFQSLLSTSTLMRMTKLFPDSIVEELCLFQDVSVPCAVGPNTGDGASEREKRADGKHIDEFMEWLHDVRPVWLCPIRPVHGSGRLFATNDNAGHSLEMDLGFYGIPRSLAHTHSMKAINRELEERMVQSRGRKGLYAFVYADRDEFWEWFEEGSRRRYEAARKRWGGETCFVDIWDKCRSAS